MNNFDDLKIDVDNIPVGAKVDILCYGTGEPYFILGVGEFVSYDKKNKLISFERNGKIRVTGNFGLRAHDERWQLKNNSMVMY